MLGQRLSLARALDSPAFVALNGQEFYESHNMGK